MGLDTVPDAEFIKIKKIIKKKGRPLKDLFGEKKPKNTGSLQQLLSSYNYHNATAVGWHFKVIDIQLKFLKFNIVFNSIFIIFINTWGQVKCFSWSPFSPSGDWKGVTIQESTDTSEETA